MIMKKYLKRWNKLTKKQKLMFFENYEEARDNGLCIFVGRPYKLQPTCSYCLTIFPTTKKRRHCPCLRYEDKLIEDEPYAVLKYCFEKEEL